ncbi:MAG TPA: ATP-binding cassette domain-containing protein [Thermoanaerobaculia bacterium]|nr:ATP-binding cassette domain-containing protein [Thermoanaerobaculia bacterium]
MQEVLTVQDVSKTFGSIRAVDHISFSVRRGTITGLLGRNGAGKTTTIRMITGIFMPDSGTIVWSGAGEPGSFRDRIGYLPEERGLYKQMRVVEHLLFLAEIKGKRPADIRPSIDRWLSRFELSDKSNSKVEELSKGNQQKVQLIGTLLHDPELIILDEPFSGLDPVNVVLVRNLLRELKEEGRTILLSTHQMGEAEKMADDIVLIHRGKVVLSGDLDEVRHSFGSNTLHIEFDGDGSFLAALPGVSTSAVLNNSAELVLEQGGDAQTILQASLGRIRIRRFELATPSLEQIFIGKVGADTLSAEVAS